LIQFVFSPEALSVEDASVVRTAIVIRIWAIVYGALFAVAIMLVLARK
jgi:hypothetical protein